MITVTGQAAFATCMVAVLTLYATLSVVTSDWINGMDGPESFQCPNGQFLSHINSEHSNYNEDRRWSLGCSPVPIEGTVGSCEKTNYVNNYDETFMFQCPGEGFITGMDSVHDNYYEDRRFKFQCCSIEGAVAHNCYNTAYQNALDGVLDYRVPTTKILRGIESFHSNYNEDRRFRFEICDYKFME